MSNELRFGAVYAPYACEDVDGHVVEGVVRVYLEDLLSVGTGLIDPLKLFACFEFGSFLRSSGCIALAIRMGSGSR